MQARTNSTCSINSASSLYMQMHIDIRRAARSAAEAPHELASPNSLRGLVHDLRHRAGALKEAVAHLRSRWMKTRSTATHVVEHREPGRPLRFRGARSSGI